MTVNKLKIIYSTFPDKKSAEEIASKLIKQGMIGCANLVSGSSIYYYDNKMINEAECYAIFKTTAEKIKETKEIIASMHPYSTPAIITIDIEEVNDEYFSWIKEMLFKKNFS